MISGDDFTAVDLVLNGGSGVISVVAGAFPIEFSKIITLAKKNKTKEAKEGFNKIKVAIKRIFFLNLIICYLLIFNINL